MAVEWARQVVDAPDLREMGRVLTAHLRSYAGKPAPDCDILSARLAFERMVYGVISRAHGRGLSTHEIDPDFPDLWRDFVVENESLEQKRERRLERRTYERGRSEALAAVADGLIHPGCEQVALLEPDRRVSTASRQPGGREEARVFIRAAMRRQKVQGDAQSNARDHAQYDEQDDLREGRQEALQKSPQSVFASPDPPSSQTEVRGGLEVPLIAQSKADSASTRDHELVRSDAALDMLVEAGALPAHGYAAAHRPSSGTFAALREHFDIDAELIAPGSKPIALSQGLEAFLTEMRKVKGDDRARADVAPIVNFMIDLVGDIELPQFSEGHRRRVDEALVDIPFPGGFPN
ncbi:MAG: hypothetical protein MEP57_09290 [Microvirga sp.]|nr:hypothetical protein [Microvirga sp.]